MDCDPQPLSWCHVVGQIVEHAVETVAAQADVVARFALAVDPAVDIEPRVAMEIERSPHLQVEHGPRVYGESAIDDQWLVGRQRLLARDVMIAQEYSVPRPDVEIHLLHLSALESKDQIVLHLVGTVGVLDRGSGLDIDTDAVALSDLDVRR